MMKAHNHRGLVMLTALMILLTLSAASLMQLHSIITEVGTSRWYRIDAVARTYAMGGANAVLGTAIKNPMGFENYLKRNRNPSTGKMQMDERAISQYFTQLKNDNRSVFAPDRFLTGFLLETSDPEIINSVPGYEMGKYCMKKYYIKVTSSLLQTRPDSSMVTYNKHMRGVLLIGPSICE